MAEGGDSSGLAKTTLTTAAEGTEHATKTASEDKGEHQQPKATSAKFSDPKEFAAYLGIPFASLQMLMKDHKERDPLVQ